MSPAINPGAAALPAATNTATNASIASVSAQIQAMIAANPQLANNPTLMAQAQQAIAAANGVAGGGAAAPAPQPVGAVTAGGGVTGPVSTTTQGTNVPVTLTPDASGLWIMTPPTGRNEAVLVNGKLIRFDATGKQTRLFALTQAERTVVDLDAKEGIATGINNLSKLVAARQERTKKLSDALAADANENGNINQVDIQQLMQENQTTEHITGLQKKIYDSVQNSITAWLR